MIAALAAVLLDASPPPTASSADAAFTAARVARSSSVYAHYTVYATVVRFREGGRLVTSTWDTVEDMQRRFVHAHGMSREENAHPHVPHGINVGIAMGRGGILAPGEMPPRGTIINPEAQTDPLGEMTFAIDQDFGLALNAPSIGASADMSEVSKTVASLPHIGRTGTLARIYEVTDLGVIDDRGVALHRLDLRPLRDPHRNRLRELWLDPKTSLPVRAIVEGVGNRSPLRDVRWDVAFAQDHGGTYIARETALAPLPIGDRKLEEVTITFADARPTNTLTALESLGLSDQVGTTDP